ncbi:MAG: hypothetical protein HY556_02850 [Euryarchaeota archaeon]|nr:hypothetical protein [Euryarchaeota archaeon]
MTGKKGKILRSRGQKSIELPYLMSCANFLLDRRYWILGIRYPWYGIRFDIVIRDQSLNAQVILVEAKYRSDQRQIRPSEIEHFHHELKRANSDTIFYNGRAFFMTNTTLSEKALELARKHGIRTFPNVPLIYKLRNKRENEEAEETEEDGDAGDERDDEKNGDANEKGENGRNEENGKRGEKKEKERNKRNEETEETRKEKEGLKREVVRGDAGEG